MLKGHGNNGGDGLEGVRAGNVIGTYLHGPLLPKNAWFADWLIATALGLAEPLARARRRPRGRGACGGAAGRGASSIASPPLDAPSRFCHNRRTSGRGRPGRGDLRGLRQLAHHLVGDRAPPRRTTTTTLDQQRRHRPRPAARRHGATATTALPGAGKPTITVGDKNFAEQFVLGQLYAQALRAQGFSVNINQNIGPTDVTDAGAAERLADRLSRVPQHLQHGHRGLPPRLPHAA